MHCVIIVEMIKGGSTIERMKEEKLKSLQKTVAEAIINSATDSGMVLKAAFADEKIELEFTQSDNKQIKLYVKYEDFSTGGYKLISLVKTLEQRNK